MDVSNVIDFTLKFFHIHVGLKVAKNRILQIPIRMALGKSKNEEFARSEMVGSYVVRQE
jgi:hypothetical protein